jgi:CxxC motif-containing protein
MAERIITCINCPMGCRMTVALSEAGEVLSVTGNTCRRGEKYAHQEVTAPVRMVTAVVPVEGSVCPLSVKTKEPIPKGKIADCMAALRALKLTLPVRAGDVVLPDVCGTGIDVIATRSL